MLKNTCKDIKLISGGIDSFIMAKQFPNGKNIYVDFGQPYKDAELAALVNLGVNFEIIRIEHQQRVGDNIYIPDRNLAMASVIAMIYNPERIFMAGLRDDNCVDKTPAEFERISALLSRYANHPIEVISPYWNKSKGEIIEEFCREFPGEILKETFSCYSPKTNLTPCGDCPACLRRVIALETNGIKTGLTLSDRIIREYLSKIYRYDSDRVSRFFIYLKNHGGVEAFDIDGILAKDNGPYQSREFLGQLPARKTKYRVIYTARLESDRQITEKWLKENGVNYDVLIMNKLPYDTLYDDNTRNKI